VLPCSPVYSARPYTVPAASLVYQIPAKRCSRVQNKTPIRKYLCKKK
jgi:hypothetical protein